jgi:hypothetical protein
MLHSKQRECTVNPKNAKRAFCKDPSMVSTTKKTKRERITGVRQNGCGKATEGLQRSRFLRWVALIKVY